MNWRRKLQGRREHDLNEDAKQMFNQGDREGALRLWRELATTGDGAAAANMVIECAADELYDEAFQWWGKAVERGMDIPVHEPGVRLRTMQRRPAAEGWWRKAAEVRNDDTSREHLGAALREQGRSDEAEEWLKPGAERGHGGCARELATLYMLRKEEATGDQVKRAHAARALNWAQRAAVAGDARARVLLLRLDR
ncbi:tetratricopeptide repeat protein [Streptomyces sp. NPDC048639]|uniref:tetratricopeptide repeat protein n=1 Tax=Streptomyces sp. NPDC048639 TaxID=3365581 RepID=UPI00371DD36F